MGWKATYDGSALENTANDPDKTGKDDGLLAAYAVSEVGDKERTDKRASRHRSNDGTLRIRTRLERHYIRGMYRHAILSGAPTFWKTLKYASFLTWSSVFCLTGRIGATYTEDTGHRRDVEAEKSTTNAGKRSDDVLDTTFMRTPYAQSLQTITYRVRRNSSTVLFCGKKRNKNPQYQITSAMDLLPSPCCLQFKSQFRKGLSMQRSTATTMTWGKRTRAGVR